MTTEFKPIDKTCVQFKTMDLLLDQKAFDAAVDTIFADVTKPLNASYYGIAAARLLRTLGDVQWTALTHMRRPLTSLRTTLVSHEHINVYGMRLITAEIILGRFAKPRVITNSNTSVIYNYIDLGGDRFLVVVVDEWMPDQCYAYFVRR